MCGFVGFTAVDYDTDTNKAVVKDMADRIAHRGPDDEGFFVDDDIAMGFRRLSIIDLEGSRQPMQNADGTVTYSVSTTLTNTFTLDEAAVAPAYIIGYSPAKRSDDDLFVNLLLVAPAGGSISGVTASNGAGAGEATLYGHDAWRVDVNLYAQESVTITYQVTVSAEAIQELEVHQTPLAQRW